MTANACESRRRASADVTLTLQDGGAYRSQPSDNCFACAAGEVREEFAPAPIDRRPLRRRHQQLEFFLDAVNQCCLVSEPRPRFIGRNGRLFERIKVDAT